MELFMGLLTYYFIGYFLLEHFVLCEHISMGHFVLYEHLFYLGHMFMGYFMG